MNAAVPMPLPEPEPAPPDLPREAARRRFLRQLSQVLRSDGDTASVLQQVSALLGAHFGVDRVGFGQVDERLDRIDYEVCWTNGRVPPLLGRFPAHAFGQQVIDRLRAGESIVIANVREHALTADQAAQRTSHEVDTRAILVVPLFRAGRLRTIVYLNQTLQRDWAPHEVGLMNEVAERSRELIERGRVEQALRASEARWRGLFERMGEGFFIGRAVRDAAGAMVDFRFVEANPAFEQLTGIPVAEALGRCLREVIPGVQDEIVHTYARVVDRGEPADFEVQVPALDDRWYEVRARAIGEDQFSVLFLEITERKRAEAALQASRQRYRTLFDSIDEGFCILQLMFDVDDRPVDYRFVEINPAFERHTGLHGALGRTVLEVVPDIERSWIETYGQVALTGEPVRFESHAQPLGRWFDVFAFRTGEPGARQVALLFNDISVRKRAELHLRERERELREAQRLARLGSWTWNPVSDLTESSPELLDIFGFGPGGRLPPFAQQRGTMYEPGDWDRLQAEVQRVLRDGGDYALDLRAFRHGRPIWVTARGTAVRDAGGEVTGLRGTVQDITERKLAEQALREADVRKDEFLATLAHELRNPLAPIGNGMAVLRREPSLSAGGQRSVVLMERQLRQLVRLVDDLLDVSRISRGKIELRRRPTTLSQVVDVALETVRPLVDRAGQVLSVALPAQDLALQVDDVRLAQVVANLLNNASKYTPPGGRITVRAQQAQDPPALVLTVADTGQGIPPDQLERIFELFTQLDGPPERAQGGLGIGLSLALHLIDPANMDLAKVVGGLSVSFYTTLVALVASAVLAFVQHAVQEQEERALNAAGQYCLRNLINRVYIDHDSPAARP